MFLKQKNKKVYKLRLCLTKFYMQVETCDFIKNMLKYNINLTQTQIWNK